MEETDKSARSHLFSSLRGWELNFSVGRRFQVFPSLRGSDPGASRASAVIQFPRVPGTEFLCWVTASRSFRRFRGSDLGARRSNEIFRHAHLQNYALFATLPRSLFFFLMNLMNPSDLLDFPPGLSHDALWELLSVQSNDPDVIKAIDAKQQLNGGLVNWMSQDSNVAKMGELYDAATYNFSNRVPAGDARRLVDDDANNITTDKELSELCVYGSDAEQDERPESAFHNVKKQRITRSPGAKRRRSTNENSDAFQRMMYGNTSGNTTVMVSRDLNDGKAVVYFPEKYAKEDCIQPGITTVFKSELKPWVRCDKKLKGFPNAVCLECADHSLMRPCFFCELPDDEDNKEETAIEVRDEGFSLTTCLDEFYSLKPRKQQRIMCNVLKPMVFDNVYKNIIELQFNSKFWKNYTAMCLSRERIRRNDASFNTLTNKCDFAVFFYRFMGRKCYRPVERDDKALMKDDEALMKDEKNGVNINGEFKAFMNSMYDLLIEDKANEVVRQWENSFLSHNDSVSEGAGSSSFIGASASVSASMFVPPLPMPNEGSAYV